MRMLRFARPMIIPAGLVGDAALTMYLEKEQRQQLTCFDTLVDAIILMTRMSSPRRRVVELRQKVLS